VARIYHGLQDKLFLGNLDAKRDWGYAPEYVEAMWLMLQEKEPDDYVIATGESHTVREFATEAFKNIDIELEWKGTVTKEKGIDKKTGKILVEVDPDYFRPTEVESLIGDSSKAKKKLGWKAEVTFKDLIKIMVQSDLKNVKNDK
jgi:GDPmannose 4,6-dehydratase